MRLPNRMSKLGLLSELTKGIFLANGQSRAGKYKRLEWVPASNEIRKGRVFWDRAGSQDVVQSVKRNSNYVEDSSLWRQK